MKLLLTRRGSQIVRQLLNWLTYLTGTRRFERLAAFAGVGSMDSQEDIFNVLQGYYSSDTEFIVLPMDFAYMGAGPSRQTYLDQLGELRQLKRDPIIGPRIHPFVAVDPRRPDFFEVARDFVENQGFAGIKVYPALGFFPFDDRLTKLWQWAESEQIPVMSHCSRGGVYFRGTSSEIERPSSLPNDFSFTGPNTKWTDQLSDPVGFRRVLRSFPNLKVCLAHMGGEDECEQWLSEPWPFHLRQSNWLSVILGLMKEFPNVYTDLSYVGYQSKLHPLMHVLVRDPGIGGRILFGSDFYMVHQSATEREFSIRLRSVLSEDEFRRISHINPQHFLAKA
ncbi:MAG: amidohydrolase family protein [Bacteroidetes bacterium]|nr:amidohydrolase family protein [Bacteroidota bacterium]